MHKCNNVPCRGTIRDRNNISARPLHCASRGDNKGLPCRAEARINCLLNVKGIVYLEM